MALRPAPYDPAKNEYPKRVYKNDPPEPGAKGVTVNSKAEEDEFRKSAVKADDPEPDPKPNKGGKKADKAD